MQQNEWEDRYQQGQTGWDRGISSENLAFWLDQRLLTKCRVLIPGCGNGYEVQTLAEMGFEVTAIDIAPTAIQNLQAALDKVNLKATLIEGDFFSWQPETRFDSIYEQTSLCALPPDLWQAYENQLNSWLKPAGKLFAQFMQTGTQGGPPYHCEINAMKEIFTNERWLWSEAYRNSEAEELGNKTEIQYLLEKR